MAAEDRMDDEDEFRLWRERPLADTLTCLRLENASLQSVMASMDELRRSQPQYRFLCTLDDLQQCFYTSGHALSRIEFDYEDYDYEDAVAVHAHEVQELHHLAALLDDPGKRVAWGDILGEVWLEADELGALVALNLEPDRVLDEVVYIKRLPVPRDDLLIAGLPNGYFTSDLGVFQNHALIRRMQDQHGYRFFGIGASWLGFVRDTPLEPARGQALTTDLAALYGLEGSEPEWQVLSGIWQASPYMLLGYTSQFMEPRGRD